MRDNTDQVMTGQIPSLATHSDDRGSNRPDVTSGATLADDVRLGYSRVRISGTVVGSPTAGTTTSGVPACAFLLATSGQTRVRVNAFGSLATECVRWLLDRTLVDVAGELMNRRGQYGRLTEVRASSVAARNEAVTGRDIPAETGDL